MRGSVWSGAFLLVVMAVPGCAPLMSPYAAGYRRYPVPPAAAVAIDPDRAARGRWDAVMRLPAGTVVDVLSQDGGVYVGALTAVDRSSVRLSVGGVEEEVARGEVLRVDLVDLPGTEVGAVAKRAGVGAAPTTDTRVVRAYAAAEWMDLLSCRTGRWCASCAPPGCGMWEG